jgi:hypothetical protein
MRFNDRQLQQARRHGVTRFCATLVGVGGCLCLAILAQAATRPNLDRPAVVGDSLMAGYREGGLADRYQEVSIPAVIAKQAGVPLPQPLIAWPGMPPVLGASGVSTGRVDMFLQAQNLAVPAHTVSNALYTRPDMPMDSLTDLVLGLPGLLQGVARSQVEWAEALQPTTLLVWIGNMDVLNGAIYGDPALMTPEADFKASYRELLARLKATGASLFVANIPDIGSIPFVQPVPAVAAMLGVPLDVVLSAGGVTAQDSITLNGVAYLGGILQGRYPGPLPGAYVLTPVEIQAIRNATTNYNAFIAQEVQTQGAVLVDTYALLNRLLVQGAQAGNRHLSASYLGGIFSQDGIHPTTAANAVVANEFIAALNQAGAQVPSVVWLSYRNDANGYVVSWPASATGYVLEAASRLAPQSWAPVQSVPTVRDGFNEVALAASEAQSYLRLRYSPVQAR